MVTARNARADIPPGFAPFSRLQPAVSLVNASLLDFLLLVMRCQGPPLTMRLDAGKNAASLTHEKPARKAVVVDRRPSSVAADGLADPGSSSE